MSKSILRPSGPLAQLFGVFKPRPCDVKPFGLGHLKGLKVLDPERETYGATIRPYTADE